MLSSLSASLKFGLGATRWGRIPETAKLQRDQIASGPSRSACVLLDFVHDLLDGRKLCNALERTSAVDPHMLATTSVSSRAVTRKFRGGTAERRELRVCKTLIACSSRLGAKHQTDSRVDPSLHCRVGRGDRLTSGARRQWNRRLCKDRPVWARCSHCRLRELTGSSDRRATSQCPKDMYRPDRST